MRHDVHGYDCKRHSSVLKALLTMTLHQFVQHVPSLFLVKEFLGVASMISSVFDHDVRPDHELCRFLFVIHLSILSRKSIAPPSQIIQTKL